MPPEVRDLSKEERIAKAKEVIAESLEDKKLPPSWATALKGASWSPYDDMPPEVVKLSKEERVAKAKEVIDESNTTGELPPSWATALVGFSKGGKWSPIAKMPPWTLWTCRRRKG